MLEGKVTHKMSLEEVLDIVSRRTKGESIEAIAKVYGVHRNTITHHLRRYGLTICRETCSKGNVPHTIYAPPELLEFVKTKYGKISPVIVALLTRLKDMDKKA